MLGRVKAFLDSAFPAPEAPSRPYRIVAPSRTPDRDPGRWQRRDEMSALDWIAHLFGEPIGRHPRCVSPVLATFCDRLNERLGDERSDLLVPWLPHFAGTGGDGRDDERITACTDWLAREMAPALLAAGGAGTPAEALRRLAPLEPQLARATELLNVSARDRWDAAWRSAGADRASGLARHAAVDVAAAAARGVAEAVTGWAAGQPRPRGRGRDPWQELQAVRAGAVEAARPAAVSAALAAAGAGSRDARQVIGPAAQAAAGAAATAAAQAARRADPALREAALASAVAAARQAADAAAAWRREPHAFSRTTGASIADIYTGAHADGSAAYVAIVHHAADDARTALAVAALDAGAAGAAAALAAGGPDGAARLRELADDLERSALQVLLGMAAPAPADIPAPGRDAYERLIASRPAPTP